MTVLPPAPSQRRRSGASVADIELLFMPDTEAQRSSTEQIVRDRKSLRFRRRRCKGRSVSTRLLFNKKALFRSHGELRSTLFVLLRGECPLLLREKLSHPGGALSRTAAPLHRAESDEVASVEPGGMNIPIITAAVSLALILVAVTGYVAYKKKKAKYRMELHDLLCNGSSNVPEYAVTGTVEGVLVFYVDIVDETAKVRHDWMREYIKENREEWNALLQDCLDYRHTFKDETDSFNQDSGQTEGAPIIQKILGCEWDNETDKVNGYMRYGNNGEDFISFDMDTQTWINLDAKAEAIKKNWDGDEARNVDWKLYLTTECPLLLRNFLAYGKSYLTRKDPPSVSLLQRTPSSPVTCHATGFYPDRALMFWRRDREEIHEGVEHGEILLNHDESFQMSVHLNVSSISPEDWSRYDCVFQLSDVQNVTELNKDAIKTNFKKKDILSEVSIATIATMAVVIVIIVAALGSIAIKKKNNGKRVKELIIFTWKKESRAVLVIFL
ncbi:major histocompatibility complex class I-related gene protein-like [Leuresthes tenuis]|uniref:major histocompatibility complex class I-related gene protein-like n=1 Tax=Leuresthes tenuis TaxID=355514 RepID=UPI003B50E542